GADDHASLFKTGHVNIVDLVPMAMPFIYLGPVDLVGARTRQNRTTLRAFAHGATQIGTGIAAFYPALAVLPFIDQGDNRMGGSGIEFGAVCTTKPGDIAREFHHGQLHPEADAKERSTGLACVPDRPYLAFRAALAEAARYQDRIK